MLLFNIFFNRYCEWKKQFSESLMFVKVVFFKTINRLLAKSIPECSRVKERTNSVFRRENCF